MKHKVIYRLITKNTLKTLQHYLTKYFVDFPTLNYRFTSAGVQQKLYTT